MSKALVTGGSKGIGAAIAEALAKRKVDLLLVARNEKDLADIKLRLEQEYKISALTFSSDFTKDGAGEKLSRWVTESGKELNIFCHVAGMGGARDFRELSFEEIRSMVRANFEFGVELCWRLIPTLKRNAPSHILLVGSMAGFAPIPQKAIYSASKSALYFFSRSLRRMLMENKVSVSCLCPGPIFTKSSIKDETIKQLGRTGQWMALAADQVGDFAVSQMLKGKMLIIPGRLNRFISIFMRILPQRLLVNLFYRNQRTHLHH